MAKYTHVCPKLGCDKQVRRSKLACPEHWTLVSPAAGAEVYRAYRSGNVLEHLMAMKAAIAEINR